jgi:hypothetical protein
MAFRVGPFLLPGKPSQIFLVLSSLSWHRTPSLRDVVGKTPYRCGSAPRFAVRAIHVPGSKFKVKDRAQKRSLARLRRTFPSE